MINTRFTAHKLRLITCQDWLLSRIASSYYSCQLITKTWLFERNRCEFHYDSDNICSNSKFGLGPMALSDSEFDFW